MGALECAGCTMIAFGPPFAVFAFVIARDPLRIILFILGAFFWLVSLLLSALWWFAVVPLRKQLAFGLFFSVAFQELFRFLYFLVISKAQKGLERVSESGMQISGVHSLKHARHTVAMVSGLGFGVMSGAFSLVNVLADSWGPGTVGFTREAFNSGIKGIQLSDPGHGNQYFFFTSSLTAAAFILLHVCWTVVFWDGCTRYKTYKAWWVSIVGVVMTHGFASGLSLFNSRLEYYISIPFTYIILIMMATWALSTAGASWTSFRAFVSCCCCTISASSPGSVNSAAPVLGGNDFDPIVGEELAPGQGVMGPRGSGSSADSTQNENQPNPVEITTAAAVHTDDAGPRVGEAGPSQEQRVNPDGEVAKE